MLNIEQLLRLIGLPTALAVFVLGVQISGGLVLRDAAPVLMVITH